MAGNPNRTVPTPGSTPLTRDIVSATDAFNKVFPVALRERTLEFTRTPELFQKVIPRFLQRGITFTGTCLERRRFVPKILTKQEMSRNPEIVEMFDHFTKQMSSTHVPCAFIIGHQKLDELRKTDFRSGFSIPKLVKATYSRAIYKNLVV